MTTPPTMEQLASEIYAAYPRKVARPKALKAIIKVIATPPRSVSTTDWAAQILGLTKLYAAARAGESPEFTPHAATFFNQRRFEDDPSTWGSQSEVSHAPDPNSQYGF